MKTTNQKPDEHFLDVRQDWMCQQLCARELDRRGNLIAILVVVAFCGWATVAAVLWMLL